MSQQTLQLSLRHTSSTIEKNKSLAEPPSGVTKADSITFAGCLDPVRLTLEKASLTGKVGFECTRADGITSKERPIPMRC
jgi:hypothetical protein